ncbi:MAG: riboflavin synthase [bacterium]|nr:riboflavin synthase [bacterium]
MFTGIIEEIGKVLELSENSIQIQCKEVLSDLKFGDSIAVNGTCLTVRNIFSDSFIADISPVTYRVTMFRYLQVGSPVNLERAMSSNGRFGGHIVSGHVESVGKIICIARQGDFYLFEIEADDFVMKYIVGKGSVSLNGISLTVADAADNGFKLMIIPHTFDNTNLKYLKQGDFVNIEPDILSKYVEKFLLMSDNKSRINFEFLQENGF